MKISKQQLKQLVDERVSIALNRKKLNENQSEEREQGDSIDIQIDKKLIAYEHDAKSVKNEGVDLRSMAYRFLYEANSEEDEDMPKDDSSIKLSVDSIEINEFAMNVARLINNVDSLLEFKDAILKRSMNFLRKTYDESVVEQFVETMDQQFDMVVGEDDVDKEHNNTPPPAIGAGPELGA